MFRLTLSVIVTSAFFVLAMVLIFFVEAPFLEDWWQVAPQAGTTQQKWLQHFLDIAMIQAIIAAFFTLLWNVGGYFYYRITDWQRAGGRYLWGALFFALLVLTGILSWQTNVSAQDKAHFVALFFYLFNSALVYWGASLCLSPSTIKYAPLGAQYSPFNRFV